jgi:hypothetical protein
VIHRFLELRGHGTVLTSMDLHTLSQWQKNRLTPDSVAQGLEEVWVRVHQRGTSFPASLKALERTIKRLKAAQIGGQHGVEP